MGNSKNCLASNPFARPFSKGTLPILVVGSLLSGCFQSGSGGFVSGRGARQAANAAGQGALNAGKEALNRLAADTRVTTLLFNKSQGADAFVGEGCRLRVFLPVRSSAGFRALESSDALVQLYEARVGSEPNKASWPIKDCQEPGNFASGFCKDLLSFRDNGVSFADGEDKALQQLRPYLVAGFFPAPSAQAVPQLEQLKGLLAPLVGAAQSQLALAQLALGDQLVAEVTGDEDACSLTAYYDTYLSGDGELVRSTFGPEFKGLGTLIARHAASMMGGFTDPSQALAPILKELHSVTGRGEFTWPEAQYANLFSDTQLKMGLWSVSSRYQTGSPERMGARYLLPASLALKQVAIPKLGSQMALSALRGLRVDVIQSKISNFLPDKGCVRVDGDPTALKLCQYHAWFHQVMNPEYKVPVQVRDFGQMTPRELAPRPASPPELKILDTPGVNFLANQPAGGRFQTGNSPGPANNGPELDQPKLQLSNPNMPLPGR